MTTEEKKQYMKEYRKSNKEKIKKSKKAYNVLHKEDIRQRDKERRAKNKDKLNEKTKEWKNINQDKVKEYRKKYYKLNKENEKQKKKIWNENNKHITNKRARDRKINDCLFKLKSNVITSISNGIRRNGYLKKSKTNEMLDCSFEYFKSYIESLWEPWMNWDNYGSVNGKQPTAEGQCWDIDHIVPLNSAKTKEGLIRLLHYSNTQPLCSYINRWVKSGK